MLKKTIISSSMPEYWEKSYKSGEIGWDLGAPTPIFDQWIKACKAPLSICILGAGNGWDAINIANRGHLVTAVDFAASAIKNIQTSARKADVQLVTHHINIFKLPKLYISHFDIILEYTCFCAIDPSDRRKYLEMVRYLLKPSGEFVALLFPIDNKPDDGGPPFSVKLDTTITMISEYLTLIAIEHPTLSVKSRLGREVFIRFKKDEI